MFRLPKGLPKRERSGRSALEDMREGLGYVRRNRAVALLLSMSFVVVMIGFPYQGFLASITREQFDKGAIGLGAISSLTAVGALIATLAVATLTGHRHAWRIQVVAGILFGCALIGLGLAPSYAAGLAVALFVGATASGFQSLNSALSMTLTEPRYYGRIQALMGLSWSLFGIVSLPLGLLADRIGIRETLVLMGLGSIIALVTLELAGRALGAEAAMQRQRDGICAPTSAGGVAPRAAPARCAQTAACGRAVAGRRSDRYRRWLSGGRHGHDRVRRWRADAIALNAGSLRGRSVRIDRRWSASRIIRRAGARAAGYRPPNAPSWGRDGCDGGMAWQARAPGVGEAAGAAGTGRPAGAAAPD
jgi:hypothetical protein